MLRCAAFAVILVTLSFSQVRANGRLVATINGVLIGSITNSMSGEEDFFTLRFPPQGCAQRCPVLMVISPYKVVPPSISSNKWDVLWSALVHQPPYYDVAMEKKPWTLSCSTSNGDCVLPHVSMADLGDVLTEGDFSGVGRGRSSAMYALMDGFVMVVAYTSHHRANGPITQAQGLVQIAQELSAQPLINGKKIAIAGRSQGGMLAIYAHALGFPFAGVIAEAAPIDIPSMARYYLEDLPRIQPPSVYARSKDFMAGYFNRWFKELQSNYDSATYASLASHMTADVLLISSSDDAMVPAEQSRNFYQALGGRGKLTLQEYQNGLPPLNATAVIDHGHGLMDASSPPEMSRPSLVRKFLQEVLLK
jgi:hypothetical protein